MNFGLIGAGEIGSLRASAIAAAGHRLVAAADIEIARARLLSDQALHDPYALIARDDLDAVIISTPPAEHADLAVAALEAGKHVLCEKPLARNPEEARRMVEAARASGRSLATGFSQRHFPAIRFVREALEAGRIGPVRHLRAYAGHSGLSAFRNSWEHSREGVGGGALMDNGSHLIDLVRFLGGDFEQVSGLTSEAIWNQPGTEDNGFALLRSDAGVIASLHASWSEWRGYRFCVDVYGERGMARAFYGPMYALVVETAAGGGRSRRTRRFFPGVAVREKLRGWQATLGDTFVAEIEDFAAAADGERRRSADGFDGYRAVEVAHAVYSSSRERRVVRLSDPF